MESPIPTTTSSTATSEPPAKRKRTPIVDSAPPSLHPTPNNVTQINYLAKARGEKLRLIEGDAETFGDVLGMIDDYEGVLQRHESLAANLGAKLVGPLLLKSFEKLFDGPIKILQPSFALEQAPISWIDISAFARSNPTEFTLSDIAPGVKSCRFWIKGGQLEISEDDFRLIQSGAPERMIPTQPIAEDESAELGTLNILEGRLAMLIKKADAVASKARQLNYHLKGRKTAVLSRTKAVDKPVAESVETPFPPASTPLAFPSIAARTPLVGSVAETGKIQQQLLEQFLSPSAKQPPVSSRRPSAATTTSRPKPLPQIDPGIPANIHTQFHAFSTSPSIANHQDRRLSHPSISSGAASSGDGADTDPYRAIMATKIDKLAKGDVIYPPCDRCRRLKFECRKHLTACGACTRKHAKCAWRDVERGEVEFLMGGNGGAFVGGNGVYGSSVEGNGADGNGVEGNGNRYIDPGLTAANLGAVDEERALREREERYNQGPNLDAEHVLLAQFASAAGAVGNHQ